MTIAELDTPAMVVDLDRMESNLHKVADYARTHHLRLRPHTKTHKSAWIARKQLELGAAGLTVAKLGEAEALLPHLHDLLPIDLLIAFPIVGEAKLKRLVELAKQTSVTVALDSQAVARQLSDAAARADVTVGVLIEIDAGLGRVGVPPSDAVASAQAVSQMPGLRWRGITFYPGHIKSAEAGAGEMAILRSMLEGVVRDLTAAGLNPELVSGGSTPTLFHSHECGPLNEIRPGTYVFEDLNTVESGACTLEECAASVLATVISVAPGRMVIDGGSKTFSSDRPAHERPSTFGRVMEAPGSAFHKMNEEHGFINVTQAGREFRIGDRVRIVPNHVCVAMNLHERVYGLRGDQVETSWNVDARGKLQ